MTQQISQTLTVRIWADKGRRLPRDCEAEMSDALQHAAEMVTRGYHSGEIIPHNENLRGWWELKEQDEREAAPRQDRRQRAKSRAWARAAN